MDRELLEKHLAAVFKQIAEREGRIAEQRERLALLHNTGGDVAEALELLNVYQSAQALAVSYQNRLEKLLQQESQCSAVVVPTVRQAEGVFSVD